MDNKRLRFKERAGRLVGEKVRAAAYVVVHEALRSFLFAKILHWIGPEDIAHETRCWWLTKAIELKEGPISLLASAAPRSTHPGVPPPFRTLRRPCPSCYIAYFSQNLIALSLPLPVLRHILNYLVDPEVTDHRSTDHSMLVGPSWCTRCRRLI